MTGIVITNTPRPGETPEQIAARTAPRHSPFADPARDDLRPRQMRLVVLESPFAGDIEENISYARACLRDCLLRGESPIASHLLLTQPHVLDDTVPAERAQGINAGHAWMRVCDAVVVYTDRGISSGMKAGINIAAFYKLPIEYRILPCAQEA